jgi:uncharacterized membrane protein HdeD (DUF308 family)
MSDQAANSSQAPTAADLAKAARAIWWLVLIRGVLAIIFGVIALIHPGVAFVALVFTFAAFAFVDGIINIVHAVRVRNRDKRWGWLLVQGILSVLAGAVAFVFPLAAGVTLGIFALSLIGVYAIMMGISGIPAAASLVDGGRKVLGFIVAILSILLGIALIVIVFVSPLNGIVNLIWVIGVYAIIIGVVLIVAAIQARRMSPVATAKPAAPKAASL